MEPLIDLYRLPPPWGQLDRENQPQIHTVDDGTPTLPYANGRPVLDVSHESEDDDFGTLSIDERVAKLRQVHQQLMHTWAVVCPDKLSEIQAINDSVQNLAVAQPLSSDPRAMASVSVANPSGNVLGTEKLEMTQHTFDEAQHSQPLPDIGPYSINTPSFRDICSWPGPIHQGGTLTSNTCSTASTSVTYTHTICQPKMSIHSDTHAKVPVSGSGSPMIEETSLHGKIWIPTAQSTPITLPAVTQSVTSSTSLGSRYAQHLAGWTLVSCDQPQENATSSLRQSQGIDPVEAQLQHPVPESVQNPQPLPFDVCVKQLQPVLHQAFEAGMHWGTSGSRGSSSGFGQSVPVGELLSGVCVNQGGCLATDHVRHLWVMVSHLDMCLKVLYIWASSCPNLRICLEHKMTKPAIHPWVLGSTSVMWLLTRCLQVWYLLVWARNQQSSQSCLLVQPNHQITGPKRWLNSMAKVVGLTIWSSSTSLPN